MKTAPPMTPAEFNNNLLTCWKQLQSGRKIAVHRSIIKITGNDVPSAIFLSQLMYWLRVGTDIENRNGWIFKSIQQMEMETGLTLRQQRSCKNHLKSLGFIETGHFGQGKNLAFQVNLEAVSKAVCVAFDIADITLLTLEDWRKQELSFIRDYFSDSVVYHLDLVRLTGDVYIGIMLSTALHNSARHGTPGSRSFTRQRLYYTATGEQWKKDTFLGRRTQERGRSFLCHYGLISEEHYFQNARIFTHVNSHILMQMLNKNVRLAKIRKSAKKTGSQQLPLLEENVIYTHPNLESDKSYNSDMSNCASCGLKHDISANSDMTQCTSPNLESDKSYNSDMSNCASCGLKHDISANSDMTQCTSPNLESDKSYNSDMSNCANISSNDYNDYPSDSITTTTNMEDVYQTSDEVSPVNNVVVVSESEFKPAGKYKALVFPKNLKATMQPQAIKIFGTYFPNAKVAQLQELLDEVGGYGKNANNPLGILSRITRAARDGEFTAVKAPQYKATRIAIQKNEENLKQRLASLDETQTINDENKDVQNKHNISSKEKYLESMKESIRKSASHLK